MKSQEQYIKERVDDQIKWMSNKSSSCQRNYKWMKYGEIVAAASVPFLVGFRDQHPVLPVLAGAMGVLIVILGAIQQINKYYENWITYRATSETLRREKYLFLTQSGNYSGADAFGSFVQSVEAILSSENETWKSVLRSKPDSSSQAT